MSYISNTGYSEAFPIDERIMARRQKEADLINDEVARIAKAPFPAQNSLGVNWSVALGGGYAEIQPPISAETMKVCEEFLIGQKATAVERLLNPSAKSGMVIALR